jgi:hypothetical protein
MSQSTKRTLFIAAFLNLVAVLAFGSVAYQVVGQGQELTKQLDALGEQRAQEASYINLQRLADDSTEDRARLQSFFLRQESDSIDFLNRVETIAPSAGVALETNELKSLKEKDSEEEWVQASFSFSGSRENVQNFVQVLETLPYVLRLTDLEMDARSTTIWQAEVTLQVRVLPYDK